MKGTNTLNFNQATMVAALQHYLDTVVLKDGVKVVVTQVEQSKNSFGGGSDVFNVHVKEKEDNNK